MRLSQSIGGLLALLSAWAPTVSAAEAAADYYVHSLPGQPEGPLLKMHAGHIEVTPENHGNLFFWHFQNRHIGDRQRTVIWLNGGPGCSSMDGAMMEIGPYRVRGDNLIYNNGSWDEFANLLFIDNPVGTGYSYVDTNAYVNELEEMAQQLVHFLEKFFKLFPEYEFDDLYIAGESYAGQHIPYLGRAILDRNKNSLQPWSLKGLLIGNGWISPTDQYPAYLEYAYKSGILQGGTDGALQVEKTVAVCLAYIGSSGVKTIDNWQCESILTQILAVTQDMSKPESSEERCVNMYDVRLRDTYSSCGMNWPPDLKDITPYLRRAEVKRALNVDPDKATGWVECSGVVGAALRQTTDVPTVELLPDLLAEVPILLFSGDQDLICNHLGTEEMINRMTWNGGKGLEISPGVWAPKQAWTFEDEPAGIYQTARNLSYVLFYNSSHMVPFDYPRRTRDMLDRFMGVDISSIGGKPANSRIDGEKGLETSVGAHPNSTAFDQEEAGRLEEAKWNAYYKSGEVALVVVIIGALVFAYWVWHGRRHNAGYDMLRFDAISPMEPFRQKGRGDVEATAFDEAELDSFNPRRSSDDGFSVESAHGETPQPMPTALGNQQ